jgi:hypothetical protein
MSKSMVCPICKSLNEIDESSIGCYVPCNHCPHRFYVPVPPLGDEARQPTHAMPSVIPDYKAFEKEGEERADELLEALHTQRTILWWLIVAQVATVTLLIASLLR